MSFQKYLSSLLLIVLMLLSFSLVLLSQSTCNTLNKNQPFPSSQEINALVDLYNTTGPWNNNACGWTNDTNNIVYNPCSWYGITCSNSIINNSIPKIISLEITSSVGLSGQLPNSICNLTNIETIQIENNPITGTIPDCWEDVYNIKTFYLTDVQITGNIPETMGDSGTLQVFVIEDGLSTTVFPVSWSNLKNMTEFFIIGCCGNDMNMRSSIPYEWSSWSKLQVFFLQFIQSLAGSTIPDIFSDMN